MTAAIIAAVSYARHVGEKGAVLNHLAFFSLTFAQIAHVFNMADTNSSLIYNDITRNYYVWAAIGICLLLAGSALFTPALSKALSLDNMSGRNWLIAVGAGLLPLALIQVVKLITPKHRQYERIAAHR